MVALTTTFPAQAMMITAASARPRGLDVAIVLGNIGALAERRVR